MTGDGGTDKVTYSNSGSFAPDPGDPLGSLGAVVDLRGGTGTDSAGHDSLVSEHIGSVNVANNSTIENVDGSNYNDTIWGDATNNVISGVD